MNKDAISAMLDQCLLVDGERQSPGEADNPFLLWPTVEDMLVEIEVTDEEGSSSDDKAQANGP